MANTRAAAQERRRNRQAQEVTLYLAGHSLAALASQFGVSMWMARKDLLDAGVTLRKPGRPKVTEGME